MCKPRSLCIQKFHKKFDISLSGKLLMVGNKIIIRISKSLPNQCYEKNYENYYVYSIAHHINIKCNI